MVTKIIAHKSSRVDIVIIERDGRQVIVDAKEFFKVHGSL